MRVLFMGTPELAAVTLAAIYEKEGVEVVGVVTRPDKPKGRGMKLIASPVKEYALERGIPVYQPKTLKNGAFDEELGRIDPELIIVAAYGNILPHEVIVYPKYGCVNAHGSLLPKYRGASPIQRAILDGERETGITAMFMDDGLDTGDIIEKYPCEIGEDDDFGTLHDKLARLAGEAMCDVIDKIENGTVTRTPQPAEGATYAAKIEREDTILDFSEPARAVVNRIRAMNPAPCAVTTMPGGAGLKITNVRAIESPDPGAAPGTVLTVSGKGEGSFCVACGEGALLVTGVIPEGKKKMSAGDFVRGRRIAEGEVLGSH